jgi:hypothetical protein
MRNCASLNDVFTAFCRRKKTGPRKALFQMPFKTPQPRPSIIAAIEAVMMVVMMVMVAIATGNDDDARLIVISTVLAVVVVMMVVMVVIELHLLDVFIGGGDRTGFIDDLKQLRRVWNRLQQVGK